MSYSNPVTAAVLDRLSPSDRDALRIYRKNHANIWNLGFHKVAGCPFGYTLTYWFTWDKTTEKWARYVLLLFRTKHETEGHCTCAAEIAAANTR